MRGNGVSTATSEQYIAGLTDFGPGRAKLFDNSADDQLNVHSESAHHADVTEGSGAVDGLSHGRAW